ncbi:phosphotransferase [Nocardia sp. NBC_01503]|uniref:phosphotransferase enzyme family protein n=1 Tax=Nocardia sp. NBC_01503 TaxID=2975997 RepID=UPI002E7C5111|nr:phosphotransferase [Nocardia sp. NBC_01503]WTL35014.1 phosphotransferase [Nocardia sp. NBC_01503]
MERDRVFGMGSDPLVAPDWPPLTAPEIADLLGPDARIEWRSPRPLSATAQVRTADGTPVIVKRLPRTLRDAAALGEEHGFMNHLRGNGIPIPRVLLTREHGEFTYEVQELGIGDDLYRGTFSWSPYQSRAQAAAAGRTLAQLHLAAIGYDAPARPTRPLLASFTVFSSPDPIAAVEKLATSRPALADFLATHRWQAEMERLHLPFHSRLHPLLSELSPRWTHNDWHGTNLLWTHETPSTVIDFGLCDRTTAIHDLAIAIERCAVDWISLRDDGLARIQFDQVRALLDGYRSIRPLTVTESRALPRLLPLVHAEYELSEIDYFLGVVPGGNPENAEIAYRHYFLGHTAWWAGEGQALLAALR